MEYCEKRGNQYTGSGEELVHSLFPARREELISLVDDGELETTEREQVQVLHEVHETTGGRNQDVAAHLQLLTLVTGRSTTVDHARTQHRAVAQTACFVEDLASQLSGGTNNEDKRLSTNLVGQRVVAGGVRARSCELASLAHQLGEDGDEEGGCLAGACQQSVSGKAVFGVHSPV